MGLLPSITIFSAFKIIIAFIILISVGYTLGKILNIEMQEIAETLGISIILSLIVLYLLAYGIFLTRSNLLAYSVFSICIFYLACSFKKHFKISILYDFPNNDFKPFFFQKIVVSSLLFVLLILIICFNLYLRPGVITEGENGNLNYIVNWDDLMLLSQINVARDFFFPIDNPTLPGEPPYYFSWLGNALPIFLIKYFNIDQLESYLLWSPIIIQISILVLVYLITSHFSDNKWTPIFCVNFFFFSPFLTIDLLPLRSQTGLLVALSTLFIFLRYLNTEKSVYLVLSFSWIFLYGVKGNYLVALFPCFVIFYLKILFFSKSLKWNDQRILLMVPCVFLGFFLFWFSRKFFASTHFFPLPELTLERLLMKLKGQYSSIAILLPILLAFNAKKLIKKFPISFIEKLLWLGLTSIILFSIIAHRYMVSDSHFLLFLGTLTAVPIALQKLIPNKNLYLIMMFITLFIFPILAFKNKMETSPVEMTLDEFKMINYLRNETPENSVFLSNVFRYNDRPAILSALSYSDMPLEL